MNKWINYCIFWVTYQSIFCLLALEDQCTRRQVFGDMKHKPNLCWHSSGKQDTSSHGLVRASIVPILGFRSMLACFLLGLTGCFEIQCKCRFRVFGFKVRSLRFRIFFKGLVSLKSQALDLEEPEWSTFAEAIAKLAADNERQPNDFEAFQACSPLIHCIRV